MKRLALLLLFGSTFANAASLPAYWHNREALGKMSRKEYYPAYKDLVQAIEKDPLNPALQMNLGLAFSLNKEYDKSEQAYKGVLDLLPPGSKARFQALFNLAVVQTQEKKIDEALGSYQAALDIDPDSLPVKTNIELLMQSGQGKGKGGKDKSDSKNQNGDGKQNSKDQKNDDKNKNKNQNPQDQKDQKQKQQPKPFESKDLSKEDVKKILDEIKNQEQSIRAKEYDSGRKQSASGGKDW